jgi:nucleoside-diphosphate-sugar epimerase
MLEGQVVLVTGAAGRVAFPIARELAARNKVYGMARFTNPADRDKLAAHGIEPIRKDLAGSDFGDLPEDVTHVFHAGAAITREAAENWELALEVNVRATGRLMSRYRAAKGFVYCSTGSQYDYQGRRPLRETDRPGLHSHNYSLSKIAGEAVVNFASSEFGTPATIIRIFSTYGPTGGAPYDRMKAIVEGREVVLYPEAPNNYNPIYEDDYVRLGIRALEAARSPALTVNWAGSETVSAEEYCAYIGRLVGKEPKIVYSDKAKWPIWPDVTRMHELLGRTQVPWKEGFRRMVGAAYPDLELREDA